MLEPAWEKLAEGLVNAEDLFSFLKDLNDGKLSSHYPDVHIDRDIFEIKQTKPLVFIGMDTRDSSPRLCDAVSLGITSLGV